MKQGLFLVVSFNLESQEFALKRDLLELVDKDKNVKVDFVKGKERIYEKRSISFVPKSLNDIFYQKSREMSSPEEKTFLFKAEIGDNQVIAYFYIVGSMIEIG